MPCRGAPWEAFSTLWAEGRRFRPSPVGDSRDPAARPLSTGYQSAAPLRSTAALWSGGGEFLHHFFPVSVRRFRRGYTGPAQGCNVSGRPGGRHEDFPCYRAMAGRHYQAEAAPRAVAYGCSVLRVRILPGLTLSSSRTSGGVHPLAMSLVHPCPGMQ